MKTPACLLSLLLAAFVSVPSAAPAAPFINETFDQPPDAYFWKIRGAEIGGGKLILNASGDETSFVNAMLEAQTPLAQLNFSRARLTLTLSDVELGGLAPADKQAFVVVLGSDRTSENAATGYVRICVNGDGKIILSVAGEKKDGRNIDRTIATRPVGFPIKLIALTLSREGYELKITDAVSPMVVTGTWTNEIDWAVWEAAAPLLTVKAVRRPGPGTAEATLGAFSVEAQ